MLSKMPPLIDGIAPLAARYDVLFCDVWGVVHNGVAAFTDACDALSQFRRLGGTVVLVTNAPRPGTVVATLLDRLAVPRAAYDDIVSSGDVTRSVIAERSARNVFHIGPERDLPIFDGLDLAFVSPEEAEYVVCTGLFDDVTETPEHYRKLLTQIRERDLLLLCGNPDLVVERGETMLYCAGALADLYAELGGAVVYAGKPHPPIYNRALERVQAIRGDRPEPQRVLAIGDSVRTDLVGATQLGFDCLFVTAGIHAVELGDREAPDAVGLAQLFADSGVFPVAVTLRLKW